MVSLTSLLQRPESLRHDRLKHDLHFFRNGNLVSSVGVRVGTVFSFDQASITCRVGISFISSDQACDSVQREIPATSTFKDIVDETKEVWNSDVLNQSDNDGDQSY